MVFTLHRYIFRELLKVFILAAVALTLMLSLGSVLRPVQEYGVGPSQVIHLIGYFLPITLTFVLPMAALFSASLVYGRFAADNELDACRASGVSLMSLVYPGLALAIIVAAANLILSFHVMPVFVQRAESSLKADAQQIIFRNIQRKGYYKAPDSRYLIYADNADFASGLLSGVVITEVEDYEIKKITTAENAKVRFNPHKRFNEVRISAQNTYQINPEGDSVSFEKLLVTKEFGSLMGDDIKFKKIDRMKQIAASPIEFYPVEKLARGVYAQFTAEILAEDIAGCFAAEPNVFYKLRSSSGFVEFKASKCEAMTNESVELSGQVIVVDATINPVRTLRCSRAAIYIEGDEFAPTLTIELYNAKWKRANGVEILARRPVIYGLLLPTSVAGRFETATILEAIEPQSIASVLRNGPSDKLIGLLSGLHRKIQKTLVEIKAETHSRLVFGIGCLPLIMIGIGLGIIKKGGHLLSAFGTSAVPAGVLIVCIMMGKNITKNPGSKIDLGLALMWLAVVFLCLLMIEIYRRLLKN